MFPVEKTKRKNDAPRPRHYRALGLAAALASIFIAALILQSLLALPNPSGHLYYNYTIDPTADVFSRLSFDDASAIHSDSLPIPTLPSEAAFNAPPNPWLVGWRDVEGDQRQELVVRDAATRDVIRVLGRFYHAYVTPVELSPDSQWVVFEADLYFVPAPGRESGDYPRDIWMVHTQTGEARRLSSTSSDEVAPSFTRDGLSVIYKVLGDETDTLVLHDIATGAHRLLTPNLNVHLYSWSPDKQHLLVKTYIANDPHRPHTPIYMPLGALYSLNLANGHITPLIDQPIVFTLAWSPDSQWIAVSAADHTLAEPTERPRGPDAYPYYDEISSTLWIMRPDGTDRRPLASARLPLKGLRWAP